MQNQYIKHILTPIEIKMLGNEFSIEFIKNQLYVLQEALNKIFKNFMRLSKSISAKSDSNKSKLDSLKKIVDDIQKIESEYINYKIFAEKLIMVSSALAIPNHQVKIIFQFQNESQLHDFQTYLHQRTQLVEKYRNTSDELERLIEKLNNVIEKITLSNITLKET